VKRLARRGAIRLLVPFTAALVVASAALVAPTPQPVAADPLPSNPVLRTTPDCLPGSSLYTPSALTSPAASPTYSYQTMTISGDNFDPNSKLFIFAYGISQTYFPVTADAYGVFSTTVNMPYDPYSYNERIDAALDVGADPLASAYLSTCDYSPKLVAETTCGDGNNPPIHVIGTGFLDPYNSSDITLQLMQGEGTVGSTQQVSAAASFDVIFQPNTTLASGQYTVVATQTANINSDYSYIVSAEDDFLVPCPQVSITASCSDKSGAPPDRLSIQVNGTGFLQGTDDGLDEIEITFDPGQEPQEFFFYHDYYDTGPGIQEDGTIPTLLINPYMRPEGVYTIEVRQQGYSVDPIVAVETTFAVPCPVATLTLYPSCGAPALVGAEPQQYDITVYGSEFVPSAPVVVTFDADNAAGADFQPETFQASVQSDGTFYLDINPAFRPPGSYRVAANQSPAPLSLTTGIYAQSFQPVEASATFSVPCTPPAPTLTADPTCGAEAADQPAAYSINLLGSGFAPGLVELIFDPAGTPEMSSATADDYGAFSTVFVVNGRPPGAYDIVGQQESVLGLLDQFSVQFLVPCGGAMLKITPASGAQGFVPMVEGTGFPPNATLLLHWDYGIGASQPISVQTDQDGNFTRQIVIFAHDFMGLRHLTVEQPDNPSAFSTIVVSYLVSAGTVSPPFTIDNPFGPPDPVVFRR
jgi:hypothetical protein